MSIRGIIKGIAFMAAASIVIGLLPFSYPVNAAVEGITLSGTCHVQDVGDCEGIWDASTGTLTLGTRGQSRRLEAITINMENTTGVDGSLEYRTHVENIGWQDYVSAGTMAGTAGQSLRIWLRSIPLNIRRTFRITVIRRDSYLTALWQVPKVSPEESKNYR